LAAWLTPGRSRRSLSVSSDMTTPPSRTTSRRMPGARAAIAQEIGMGRADSGGGIPRGRGRSRATPAALGILHEMVTEDHSEVSGRVIEALAAGGQASGPASPA
jgi:hypothetical protein